MYNKDKSKLIAFPHAGSIGGSFTLPSSVKEIGDSAFGYCTDLGELTLRNKLEKIGNYAFINCENLTQIKLPSSVTEIGEGAFSGCTKLSELTIPDGVTSLKKNTFMWCDKLRKLTIPKSVTYVDGSLINEVTGIYDVLTIYGYRGSAAEEYADIKRAQNPQRYENVVVSAMQLPDGTIVTGRSSRRMVATAAMVLNAIKKLAGIQDDMLIISPPTDQADQPVR